MNPPPLPSSKRALAGRLNTSTFRERHADKEAKIRAWLQHVRLRWVEWMARLKEVRLADWIPPALRPTPPPAAEDAAALASRDPQALRRAFTRFSGQHAELVEERQRVLDKFKALRAERQGWRKGEQAARASAQLAQTRFQELAAELTTAREREHGAGEKIRALCTEVSGLQRQFADGTGLLASKERILRQTEAQLKAAEAGREQIAGELRQSRTESAALQAQLAEAGMKAAEAIAGWEANYAELQEAQRREAATRQACEDLERTLAACRAELAAALAQLENELGARAQAEAALAKAEERWAGAQALQAEAEKRRYFPCLLGNGSLAPWRKQLEDAVEAGRAAAILTAAHLQLCRAEAHRLSPSLATAGEVAPAEDRRPLLHALRELSRHLYAFLADLAHSPAASAEIAQEWALALTRDFDGRIHFRVAQPGEPVSAQWMLFRNGNTVRHPRTWAVGTPGVDGLSVPAEIDAGQQEPPAQSPSSARTPTSRSHD